MPGENKPYKTKLGRLLASRIAEAPEENHGAVEAQISLRGGEVAFAGATRLGPEPGMFTAVASKPEGDPREGRMTLVELHFVETDIFFVTFFLKPSPLAISKSDLIRG